MIGGFPHEKDDPRWDSEANVRFMVEVRCNMCGYSMLFDSEKFHSGDEPTITTVPPRRRTSGSACTRRARASAS